MGDLAVAELGVAPTFITLGPSGTDHERATQRYIDFQGLSGVAKLELVDDLVDEGLERVREEPNSYLVQCSAHLQVHEVTERYPQEVFVMTTFLDATRDLSLLVRAGVTEPKKLGLVPATRGYIMELDKWETVSDEPSKPVVSDKLLRAELDAGVTFTQLFIDNPKLFRVAQRYGPIPTTWLVYGRYNRFKGEQIGEKSPWLFTGKPEPPELPSGD